MSLPSVTASEVRSRLFSIRNILQESGHAAIRFRGVDWFSWCTGGGFGGVLMTSESAVADVLITIDDAWIITDVIEQKRLRDEVVPEEFEVLGLSWQSQAGRERFIAERCGGTICSDHPNSNESPLPLALIAARSRLVPEEIGRYRSLGTDAAAAMTEAAQEASPELTEWEMAGHIARHLYERGIDPALIQVGGDERVARYRHVLPTGRRLGRRAMIAVCARRQGLYASLTRFFFFDHPSRSESIAHDTVAHIEAVALSVSRPHTPLAYVYQRLAAAYDDAGYPGEIDKHHQGGTTGYLAREALAMPESDRELSDAVAVAWNPSLEGAKIEDTFLCVPDQLELLTFDPRWPMFECDGRKRPAVMVLS